jgi:hypothetical protein
MPVIRSWDEDGRLTRPTDANTPVADRSLFGLSTVWLVGYYQCDLHDYAFCHRRARFSHSSAVLILFTYTEPKLVFSSTITQLFP